VTADGIYAAAHKRDFGTSRRQLSDEITFLPVCEEGAKCLRVALNVIYGPAKVWSLSDQQRTNCARGA
jgi:hypothetical protein